MSAPYMYTVIHVHYTLLAVGDHQHALMPMASVVSSTTVKLKLCAGGACVTMTPFDSRNGSRRLRRSFRRRSGSPQRENNLLRMTVQIHVARHTRVCTRESSVI